MFCATGLVFCGTGGVPSRFHVFGGTKGVGSRFHILRSRTHFWRYRGCRVPFSRFPFPDSFSAVLGPVFLFCAHGLVFGGSEGVRSRFHVLRSRTHFGRYRGRLLHFSCFTRPDSFSAVLSASSPVFMFCASGLVFGGTEGVPSHFHVFRSRTCFRRYRGRRVPFSYFALADSFLAVPRDSCLVFIFCALGLVFGCAEGVVSRIHFLCSRTRLWRYRWRRVPFSCFALPDSFSAVSSASGPVFTFCTLGLVFSGTGAVRSHFLILRAQTRFRRFRGRRVSFLFFGAPGLVFGGIEGVGSRFHVLRSRAHF
jgi:hypothetical protein